MPEMKRCTTCETEYPATKKYFNVSKCKNGEEHLRKICRKCANTKILERYHNVVKKDPVKMEKRRELSREIGATEERKEYMRLYKIEHREKIRELNKALDKANPEKVKERRERWLRNNKPKRLETLHRYRTNNADKVKESARKYRQTERGKELGRMFSQQRLAKKRELESTFTPDQWVECKEYFNYCCAFCGKPEDEIIIEQGFILEQEHFVALNNRGPYTKGNIIPACHSCNDSKHDHYFFNWYPSHKSYSPERENKILGYLNIDNPSKFQQLSII